MKANNKIIVSIFYFTETAPENRAYWVGTVNNDGSCDNVIKNIKGKGPEALKRAINYLNNL